MTFNWFQKKVDKNNYPDFWKEYESNFLNTEKLKLDKVRFVVFDTETTGFSKKNDRILSIGAISLTGNIIRVNDSFEIYVEQEIFTPETVKIHGILKKGDIEKFDEIEAIKQFLKYIKNAVLVAHHVGFDVGMMNQMLERHNLPKLKNTALDTGELHKKSKHEVYQNNLKQYTLDELCDELNISKSDRHTASGDALITAVAFLKILSRLNKKNGLELKDLIK
ncbi:DNA polymerase III subunit epsilon [Polaribacter vadi]|uniref:DNA polymerase III subunit epsilon n=1 Tax=Polaribacter vadi TaxID=1774273 RepID=A0A1B8TWQ5_9FLAO|nr:3'-5' exonuclease [Polaribacter vadi]AOW17006.1 DNA polymerase III subunit epsilon [Polaribacter vadi]OBY64083.1 DNA polymerase III subunit epsilon [Polaribacter vadi]|tara:strand:+ start:289 stop:954 length:666 start_codon:yes stop_codon:yes gene_type:complete